MVTVNSLSGGKTSSYMAIHNHADVNIFACVCIDHHPATPKDKSILDYALNKLNGNFIATAESDKTLKVMMDLEQIIGKEIVWVRGLSFDEVIDRAGCLPTWARRFCTTELKIRPIFEYLWPRYGKVIMNIGFRGDELDRIKKALEPEKELMKFVSSQNIETRRQKWDTVDYRIPGFPLKSTYHLEIISFFKKFFDWLIFPYNSNCMGCHHKPAELIKENYKDEPEKLIWFALQEQKGKYNTWHDDLVTYFQIFLMEFTGYLDFGNYTMCDSGGCTD